MSSRLPDKWSYQHAPSKTAQSCCPALKFGHSRRLPCAHNLGKPAQPRVLLLVTCFVLCHRLFCTPVRILLWHLHPLLFLLVTNIVEDGISKKPTVAYTWLYILCVMRRTPTFAADAACVRKVVLQSHPITRVTQDCKYIFLSRLCFVWPPSPFSGVALFICFGGPSKAWIRRGNPRRSS